MARILQYLGVDAAQLGYTARIDHDRAHPVNRFDARRALLALLWFGAGSAAIGGVLGVVFEGAGLPVEYLRGTPFDSFVVPGLILGVVVGGTQLLAAITSHRNHARWSVLGATAGFGMVIWIFAELALLGEFSWLQVVYFALGLGEIAMVLVILDAQARSAVSGHIAP